MHVCIYTQTQTQSCLGLSEVWYTVVILAALRNVALLFDVINQLIMEICAIFIIDIVRNMHF